MAAIEPLCCLFGINADTLSKEENLILEAELMTRICDELKDIFKKHYRHYFRLMKYSAEMEHSMLETNFIVLIIKDILSTQEYTLEGIAQYTDTHEDVICEVVAGINTRPSATLLRKCIELHRSVRQELYRAIIKKIATEYLAVT